MSIVVWVSDTEPDPEAVNPEVDSMFRQGAAWSDPVPVTSNSLFETNPTVAYAPDSRPMAFWTQNNLAASDSADFAVTLENQEIFCSLWSPGDSAWSPAVEITNDDPDQLGDGMAEAAFGADSVGLCVWVRTTDDDPATRTDWEIAYAVWEDSTTWSAPDLVTTDLAADCSPDVAILPDGRGLAVWLRDEDTDFATTEDTHVAYAIWDGSSWSAPGILSTTGYAKRRPRVAVTPSGRAVVSWLETAAYADTAKADSVRFIASLPGLAGWNTVRTVFGSDHFLEEPDVHATRVQGREVAMVAWRGHDGYDGDLFASMLDLDDPLAAWTQPTEIQADTLTDWMAASVVDSLANALFVSVKTDWVAGMARPAPGTFADGLYIVAKGLRGDLRFGDDLNFGELPVASDLSVSGEEIWFTAGADTILYAGEGDLVTLHARIRNTGDPASQASTARFYDGDPDSGGVQIGSEEALPALAPDSWTDVATDRTALPGIHEIFVLADPDSTEAEQREDNNRAFATLYVTADLSPTLSVCLT